MVFMKLIIFGTILATFQIANVFATSMTSIHRCNILKKEVSRLQKVQLSEPLGPANERLIEELKKKKLITGEVKNLRDLAAKLNALSYHQKLRERIKAMRGDYLNHIGHFSSSDKGTFGISQSGMKKLQEDLRHLQNGVEGLTSMKIMNSLLRSMLGNWKYHTSDPLHFYQKITSECGRITSGKIRKKIPFNAMTCKLMKSAKSKKMIMEFAKLHKKMGHCHDELGKQKTVQNFLEVLNHGMPSSKVKVQQMVIARGLVDKVKKYNEALKECVSLQQQNSDKCSSQTIQELKKQLRPLQRELNAYKATVKKQLAKYPHLNQAVKHARFNDYFGRTRIYLKYLKNGKKPGMSQKAYDRRLAAIFSSEIALNKARQGLFRSSWKIRNLKDIKYNLRTHLQNCGKKTPIVKCVEGLTPSYMKNLNKEIDKNGLAISTLEQIRQDIENRGRNKALERAKTVLAIMARRSCNNKMLVISRCSLQTHGAYPDQLRFLYDQSDKVLAKVKQSTLDTIGNDATLTQELAHVCRSQQLQSMKLASCRIAGVQQRGHNRLKFKQEARVAAIRKLYRDNEVTYAAGKMYKYPRPNGWYFMSPILQSAGRLAAFGLQLGTQALQVDSYYLQIMTQLKIRDIWRPVQDRFANYQDWAATLLIPDGVNPATGLAGGYDFRTGQVRI